MIYLHNKPSWMFPKFDAFTIMNHIFIDPKFMNNKALIEHEKTHVKQFKQDWLFPIKYLFSEKMRYKYELEAYIVQLRIIRSSDIDLDQWIVNITELLFSGYRLHKPKTDISNDLRSALRGM